MLSKAIIFSGFFFSLFASAIMMYISMATPIGPWVELIVVLLSTLFFRLVLGYVTSERLKNAVGLTTVAAGVAGIVATVCGFTVPTLYFLDPELFGVWCANPVHAVFLLSGSILIGGLFAFVMVHCCGDRLLADEKLMFPIAQMVRKMILAQNQLRKAIELFAGVLLAALYAFIQRCSCWLPQKLIFGAYQIMGKTILPSIIIRLDLLPLFLAIGYVAGDVLTVPLAIGVASKLLVLEPLHTYWFSSLSADSIILAFGAGMMIQGAVLSFIKLPKLFVSVWKRTSITPLLTVRRLWRPSWILPIAAVAVCGYAYFWYFKFSLFAQLYMLAFTAICVYQLMVIGGKIGMAPFGRFATFVMMPGFFLFGYDAMQVMLVSLFVSLSGGVAVDLMFGRKMAQLSDLNKRDVMIMQLFGLIISALVCGIIFTQLAQTWGLGSAELIAQRGRARALLVNIKSLNYVVILLGALFGFIIERIGVNGLLVFTGLLFSVDFSLMLILGGLLTYVAQDKDEWDPFWSGVFASASLCMVLHGLFK